MSKGQPKPRPGKLSMASQPAHPRKPDEPSWDDIDPAVRAAYEQRVAVMEARAADPEIQARLEASRLAAQAAPPPWERDDWLPSPSVLGNPGLNDPPSMEEKARIKERLKNHQSMARWLHYSELFGKAPKTQEQKDMAKLREARNKVRKLGDTVRTNIFNDWLARCVVKAEEPKEWTQASDLYASYVRHARQYGPSLKDDERATVTDRMVAREEMSTETGWGKMMASVSTKARRARGNYYPLKLKRNAQAG